MIIETTKNKKIINVAIHEDYRGEQSIKFLFIDFDIYHEPLNFKIQTYETYQLYQFLNENRIKALKENELDIFLQKIHKK